MYHFFPYKNLFYVFPFHLASYAGEVENLL